ncbi:MAG: hypothetical protein RLZ62_167 [Bacteroidota bacterium]|jgi:hypothetical protein
MNFSALKSLFNPNIFTGKVIRWHELLLSPATRHRSERAILVVAIISYLLHLLLILLSNQGAIAVESKFLKNPVSAIYTPFSFILVYEVYLLIYYLPRSTSYYIGKQYEIITLIVIRRIFKDIGNLELNSNWFENDNDLQFTYDAATSLVLFLLIFIFYYKVIRREKPEQESEGRRAGRFVLIKKFIAVVLVPVMIVLSMYSFGSWIGVALNDKQSGIETLGKLNNIFFDEFFSILIIVDVFILLFSFFYSDRFHTIIRNSGFVISTILIKISFSVTGLLNNTLIIGSVLFGVLILIIHNLFVEKLAHDTDA